ncbi:MAG: hypothetical protein N2422_06450 [Rhodobacteraceae bacterium]|nr:hypothetical protein [Paracoccaceae bacterium]
MIGHNRGPSLEPGGAWRRHCWGRARAELLPVLPVEVVRLRVRRAAEIGLDYRTYAGLRATTGRDLVAFLFSGNALGVLRPGEAVPPGRARRVGRLRGIGTLVAAPGSGRIAAALAAAGARVDAAGPGPAPGAGWRAMRAALLELTGPHPADGVLVIGAAPWERDWPAAARLAGFLPAERFFGGA